MAIVNINVSITNPPKPSQLLKTGALVSVGGTTLAAGTSQLLTTSTDLATILHEALAIESLAWAANTVTVTTVDPHGLENGDQLQVVLAGNAPTGYNGTYTATVTGTDTLTYSLPTDPGTATAEGTLQLYGATELAQMNTSFWAQGKSRSVYVLELGAVPTTEAITALQTFIAQDVALGNTYQTFFSYLVPRAFAPQATFKQLANLYTAANDLVYFFVTTTLADYSAWTALAYKSVYAGVESPDMPATAFDMAAHFQSTLANDPGSANQVPPMAYRFLYGTTVYPVFGNATVLSQLEAANINYVGSAAEGGLSNMMVVKGHNLDGNPFNYWYSVAWAVINLELDIANEVINGSNTTVNPLYYDQQGVDRLQKRALKTFRTGISYGLLIGTGIGTKLTNAQFVENFNNDLYASEAVINAIPYQTYVSDNPSAYQEGSYGGLTGVMTPRRGFESITFNLNVTNFVG